MREIQFEGQLTREDFLKAQILHQRPSGQATRIRVTLLIFIFLLAVIILLQAPSEWWYALLLLIPALAITSPWWLPYFSVSAFNDPGNVFRDPIQGTVSQAGITMTGPRLKSKTGWDAYTRCVLSEDLILLYQGRRGFNFLVKHLFTSNEDWNEFTRLAQIKATKNPTKKLNKTSHSSSSTSHLKNKGER